MGNDAVVLVTGASSGLGAATAKLLASRGMRVFGTSRSAEETKNDGPVTRFRLDVRSTESVETCVARVLASAGRIDALVNNAGYTFASAVEEASIEEAKAQLETNFFGAARMMRSVLPIMRRQGGGRIVNVTSLAGLLGVPFHAYYSASKFALEGLSEGLRQEVRCFGIHVSCIEPGDFRTGVTAARAQAKEGIDAYAGMRDRAIDIMKKSEQSGPDPSGVAELVARVLAARRPKLRYRVGTDARWIPRLRRLMPEFLFEAALRRNYRIPS